MQKRSILLSAQGLLLKFRDQVLESGFDSGEGVLRGRVLWMAGMVLMTTLNSSCVNNIYDSKGEVINECPVHHIPFELVMVETVYGLPARDSFASFEVSKTEFPYARTRSLRGCMVGPFSRFNKYDRVRACPKCNKAKQKYLKRMGSETSFTHQSKFDEWSSLQ